MKQIDLKSIIIGILLSTLFFVIVGANNQDNNLGFITVRGIDIVDSENNTKMLLWIDESGNPKFHLSYTGEMNSGVIISDNQVFGGVGAFINRENFVTIQGEKISIESGKKPKVIIGLNEDKWLFRSIRTVIPELLVQFD